MKNNMELTEIRKQYVDTRKELNLLHEQQRKLVGEVIILLDNEPDKDKRKEIIDSVYEGKVEEVHEYYLRTTYLEDE